MKKIKVVIDESCHFLSDTLILELSNDKTIKIVGITDTAEELERIVKARKPHVIIFGLELNEGEGIKFLSKITDNEPHTRCIVIGHDSEIRDKVLESITAGAAGYLLQDTSPAELVKSIKTVYAGGSVLSPEVTPLFIEAFNNLLQDDKLFFDF